VLAGCLVILAVIALLTAALRFSSNPQETRIDPFTVDTGTDNEFPLEETFDVTNVKFDRPDYRYSVIPRGAYTETELRTAIRTDPVVAAHYKHLDQSKLRTEVVASDRYVHVSYRKGNEIFWTKKKLLLRKGETIVTDGATQVRARCGNCISEQPQSSTSEDEPDEVEFDRLVDADGVPAPVAPQVAVVQPVAPLTTAGEVAAPGSPTPGSLAPPFLSGGSVEASSPVGDPTSRLAASASGARAATPLVPSKRDPATGASSPDPTLDPEAGPPSFFDVPGLGPSDVDPLAPPDELLENSAYVPPVNDVSPAGSPDEPANPVPVPEPGTFLLLGSGVAELIRRTTRARRK